MGFIDTIKGLLGGTGIQSALESTGLADHVEAFSSQGSAAIDTLGGDLGAGAEALGGLDVPPDLGPDIGGITDAVTNPN
jgi:hypothetical protein